MFPFIFQDINIDFGYFSKQHSNLQQFFINIFLFSLFGIIQYLGISTIFESRNPMPKNKVRLQNIKNEVKLGIKQIFLQMVYSMTFYHYIYPHCNWFGYFNENDYGILDFIYGIIFLYCFRTFCAYWVHRTFHNPILYRYVHYVHHSFREPTAFAYCATHPLEGIVEVNTLLHVAELIIPIHPVMTFLFFEFITMNEIMGHDGGDYDFAGEYRHHLYYVVNYGEEIMDKYFGTLYDPKNFPYKVKCSYVDNIENRTEAIFMKYK